MKIKTVEDNLQQLEAIIKDLEKGELDLDESLKKFEKSVEIFNECKAQLSEAEKRIKILSDTLEEKDFEYSKN